MNFRSAIGFAFLLEILLAMLLPSLTKDIGQQVDEDRGNLINGMDTPQIMNSTSWNVIFRCKPLHQLKQLNLAMTQSQVVNLTINYIDQGWGNDYSLHVLAEQPELVSVLKVIMAKDIVKGAHSWTGNFTIEGILLGHTTVFVELRRPALMPERSRQQLDVIILRNVGVMDTVFKVCAGGFVMILYINFGAVLELDELKRILMRPVGPAVGFVGQFIFMPALSFMIGYFLFSDMFELRLGLFFTGTTPGGGASNIFTVVLNGNLNLSVTMTALSNLAAFAMMPLWIFTLGASIFHDGNFVVPYEMIAFLSFSLVLPLSVGIALQKYAPVMATKVSKLLKPISLMLIVFIIAFGFTVNSYMFKLLTWKIIVASSALPWIGYMTGWIMAVLLGQSKKDSLTIAIETGIQNTGIAIFMLNFALPQPLADMASVVPVASSMMTPLPLLAIYLIRKCYHLSSIEESEEVPSRVLKEIEVEVIMAKEYPVSFTCAERSVVR